MVKEEQTTHSEGSEIESQPTSLLPAAEMIDRELVGLALESHSRAILYPESMVQHDRANECRRELLKRLNTRAEDTAALRQRIVELEAQVKRQYDLMRLV